MWKVYGQTTGHQKSWIEQKLMWAKKLKWLRGPNKIDNKCTCLIFPGIRISSSRFWSSYRYGTLCTWKPSTSLSSQKRKMFYFTEKNKASKWWKFSYFRHCSKFHSLYANYTNLKFSSNIGIPEVQVSFVILQLM